MDYQHNIDLNVTGQQDIDKANKSMETQNEVIGVTIKRVRALSIINDEVIKSYKKLATQAEIVSREMKALEASMFKGFSGFKGVRGFVKLLDMSKVNNDLKETISLYVDLNNLSNKGLTTKNLSEAMGLNQAQGKLRQMNAELSESAALLRSLSQVRIGGGAKNPVAQVGPEDATYEAERNANLTRMYERSERAKQLLAQRAANRVSQDSRKRIADEVAYSKEGLAVYEEGVNRRISDSRRLAVQENLRSQRALKGIRAELAENRVYTDVMERRMQVEQRLARMRASRGERERIAQEFASAADSNQARNANEREQARLIAQRDRQVRESERQKRAEQTRTFEEANRNARNSAQIGMTGDMMNQGMRRLAQSRVPSAQSYEEAGALIAKHTQEHTTRFKTMWDRAFQYVFVHQIYRFISSFNNLMMDSIKQAELLQIKVSEIRTISQDQQMPLEGWTKQMRQLSSQFGVDVLTVAEGAYETLSNQVARGTAAITFMNQALAFGAATVTSTAESVNLLTAALNAFNLDASNTTQVAASMFKTIDLGRVVAKEMSNTLGRTAPLAHTLGITLDELNASLAVMTIQGQKYNTASTQLRSILIKLIKPTDKMKELFAEWGVESGEAAIATFGFQNVIRKLNDEMNKANGLSRIGELLGRERPIAGLAALARDDMQEFDKTLNKFKTATEAYIKAVNISFESNAKYIQIQREAAKNYIQEVFGDKVVSYMASFLQVAGGSVKVIQALTEALRIFVGYYIGSKVTAQIVKTMAALKAFNAEITITNALLYTASSLAKVGIFAAVGYAAVKVTETLVDLVATYENLLDKTGLVKVRLDRNVIAMQDAADAQKELNTAVARYSLQNIAAETSSLNKQIEHNIDVIREGFKTLQSVIDSVMTQVTSRIGLFNNVLEQTRKEYTDSYRYVKSNNVYDIQRSAIIDLVSEQKEITLEWFKARNSLTKYVTAMRSGTKMTKTLAEDTKKLRVFLELRRLSVADAKTAYKKGDTDAGRKHFDDALDINKQLASVGFTDMEITESTLKLVQMRNDLERERMAQLKKNADIVQKEAASLTKGLEHLAQLNEKRKEIDTLLTTEKRVEDLSSERLAEITRKPVGVDETTTQKMDALGVRRGELSTQIQTTLKRIAAIGGGTAEAIRALSNDEAAATLGTKLGDAFKDSTIKLNETIGKQITTETEKVTKLLAQIAINTKATSERTALAAKGEEIRQTNEALNNRIQEQTDANKNFANTVKQSLEQIKPLYGGLDKYLFTGKNLDELKGKIDVKQPKISDVENLIRAIDQRYISARTPGSPNYNMKYDAIGGDLATARTNEAVIALKDQLINLKGLLKQGAVQEDIRDSLLKQQDDYNKLAGTIKLINNGMDIRERMAGKSMADALKSLGLQDAKAFLSALTPEELETSKTGVKDQELIRLIDSMILYQKTPIKVESIHVLEGILKSIEQMLTPFIKEGLTKGSIYTHDKDTVKAVDKVKKEVQDNDFDPEKTHGYMNEKMMEDIRRRSDIGISEKSMEDYESVKQKETLRNTADLIGRDDERKQAIDYSLNKHEEAKQKEVLLKTADLIGRDDQNKQASRIQQEEKAKAVEYSLRNSEEDKQKETLRKTADLIGRDDERKQAVEYTMRKDAEEKKAAATLRIKGDKLVEEESAPFESEALIKARSLLEHLKGKDLRTVNFDDETTSAIDKSGSQEVAREVAKLVNEQRDRLQRYLADSSDEMRATEKGAGVLQIKGEPETKEEKAKRIAATVKAAAKVKTPLTEEDQATASGFDAFFKKEKQRVAKTASGAMMQGPQNKSEEAFVNQRVRQMAMEDIRKGGSGVLGQEAVMKARGELVDFREGTTADRYEKMTGKKLKGPMGEMFVTEADVASGRKIMGGAALGGIQKKNLGGEWKKMGRGGGLTPEQIKKNKDIYRGGWMSSSEISSRPARRFDNMADGMESEFGGGRVPYKDKDASTAVMVPVNIIVDGKVLGRVTEQNIDRNNKVSGYTSKAKY
jgi:TP901 family phage tail tape measure protein